MSDYRINNSNSAGNESSSVTVSDAEEKILEGSWQLKFEGKGTELIGIFIDNFFIRVSIKTKQQ